MKKKLIVTLCLVVSLTLLLCSCGTDNDNSRKKNNTTTAAIQGESSSITPTDEALAAKALKMVVRASTAEEALPYLVDATAERAQQLADYYPDNAEVVVQFMATFRDYEVFKNTVTNPDGSETGYCLMKRTEDGYRACGDNDLLKEMTEHFRCYSCNGSGSITTGNRTACGICCGSGQQQIYDALMGYYYIGCSGCGGAGYIGTGSTVTCSRCEGECLVF